MYVRSSLMFLLFVICTSKIFSVMEFILTKMMNVIQSLKSFWGSVKMLKFSVCQVMLQGNSSMQSKVCVLHKIDGSVWFWNWRRSLKTTSLGIYQLMRSLEHLEELIIYSKYQNGGVSTVLIPVELSSPCVMPKLKSVTLHVHSKPWDRWLQLVQFVLRSATCLEKLVIFSDKYYQLTTAEELEFVKLMSRFHRSSPNASVVFA
ncbi:hypothetical protein RND81_14G185700 [Saponaria officinalis]|uniref:FBD domain-containing protein n=1 Tax=Saponaria officinalis TaxID=3572 RepID=A0AAW1GNW9_SAPOF